MGYINICLIKFWSDVYRFIHCFLCHYCYGCGRVSTYPARPRFVVQCQMTSCLPKKPPELVASICWQIISSRMFSMWNKIFRPAMNENVRFFCPCNHLVGYGSPIWRLTVLTTTVGDKVGDSMYSYVTGLLLRFTGIFKFMYFVSDMNITILEKVKVMDTNYRIKWEIYHL